MKMIRKEVIKEIYRDYIKPQWMGFLIVSLLCFFISFISHSFAYSIKVSVSVLSGLFLLGIVFFYHDLYYKRKMIKMLNSSRYLFLFEHGFRISNDSFFEGYYKDYYVKISPIYKRDINTFYINYDIIEALYMFENKDGKNIERNLTANYFLGYLIFANHRVSYVAKDCKNPNFEDNLNGLISILKRENLMPLTKEEWLNLYGK